MFRLILLLIFLSISVFARSFEQKQLINEVITQQILDQGSTSVERFNYIEILRQEVDNYIKNQKINIHLKKMVVSLVSDFRLSAIKLTQEEALRELIKIVKA